jgi:integrase
VFADAVRFAVGTGMRRGEITRLRWADLDESKHLVLVRDRKDPREKKGNHQWVPLLSQTDYGCMWALVQAQPKVSDRIFPIGESALSKYFTWACRALSIPDLHLHDMRHHAISRLFEMGYRIEQVALVSGHRSWVHLKRYTNLRPEDLHSGPSGG